MPFILIAIGVTIGYLDYLGLNNLTAAGGLLKAEIFQYQPPFYKWLGALIIVGMLGYVDELRPISQGLLILILLSIVLDKKHYQAVDSLINHV